jgi:DNA invertase Pin-like site-specific DNA recombinase
VVVAKLDRLARDAEFVLRLSREAEANGLSGFLFADLPDVDATTSAGRLILTVMASVAEFESRRISERTRDALNAAKAKGTQLGAQLPKQRKANAERAAKALERARKLEPVILPMRERGDSMATIADALNASDLKPERGGKWSVMTVKRTLERLGLNS